MTSLLRRPELGAFAAFILTYVFFAIATHGAGFVSINGTAGWLNLAAELGIVAIPVGMLMISGEFDLSIGSTVGAASMVVAIATSFYGMPIWPAIGLALLIGGLVGLANGMAVVRTNLPSFIVTLATNFIVIGATMGFSRLIANVTSSSIVSSDTAHAVFAARWGQANISILWWLGAAIVGGWVLSKTTFGNWVYATGGNMQAARGAGVPVERVKIILFIATGVAAAFVGVLQGVQWNSGNSTYGQGYVFQAPIVAVIGGVLLGGGYGSVAGIFLGTALFGVISTGIFYTGWNTDWIQLFLGVLLALAVLANNYVRRFALMARR
ncbi:ABC transporter permease [Hoeflea sp. WL0058]|uniref:Xylose transport system permease protein XylH n=1 Tax=Flavimaribacter sediminis TaxID=2865987 RepID=A0AAE2ZND2_9HYPH|nr:ABC transporter permease [Flavimaribacter sediminis]MBW8639813.1 ABC transporter permease [Flavimaribacter sediminis]